MASATRLRAPPPQLLEGHHGQKMKSISDAASVDTEAERPVLLLVDEMPEWFRCESNKWIHHGYRPISGSARASFHTWSYIHNKVIRHLFSPHPSYYLPTRRVASPVVPRQQILRGNRCRFLCFPHLHVDGRHLPIVVGNVPHHDDPFPTRGAFLPTTGYAGCSCLDTG
jgi:hypothetical protein